MPTTDTAHQRTVARDVAGERTHEAAWPAGTLPAELMGVLARLCILTKPKK